MATRTVKTCDECSRECERFADKSKLKYSFEAYKVAVSATILNSQELCQDCAEIIIKKALLDAREPLIKRRDKPAEVKEEE